MLGCPFPESSMGLWFSYFRCLLVICSVCLMLIVLTKLYRQNGSLLTLKVLSVKQNSSGSTEECGQRGLSECYFCINSALRFAQWVQWLKQTTLHHLMTAEKIGGLLPLLGNFAVMVIDYLPFESVWKHAGIIYFESWASWSFERKRECIGLVQSVSNCFKQCVCHDLKHGVVWHSMGKAVILTGCSLEALSLKRLGSGNAQFWPLETGCFSYQVKWILRASDYDLFHYYNNTDT